MSNRFQILSMINNVMTKIRHVTSRDKHFDLLDNAQILTVILQEVTQYEKSLLEELDVD